MSLSSAINIKFDQTDPFVIQKDCLNAFSADCGTSRYDLLYKINHCHRREFSILILDGYYFQRNLHNPSQIIVSKESVSESYYGT